jgi:hypothetical protein
MVFEDFWQFIEEKVVFQSGFVSFGNWEVGKILMLFLMFLQAKLVISLLPSWVSCFQTLVWLVTHSQEAWLAICHQAIYPWLVICWC